MGLSLRWDDMVFTKPLLIALGCAVAALLVLGGLWRWEYGKAVQARQERDSALAAAHTCNTARINEQQAALDDYNALQNTCRADIVQAIGKGRTIERIIQPAPAGAPADARYIPACELRDLIGQPGCGELPAVADGGNP